MGINIKVLYHFLFGNRRGKPPFKSSVQAEDQNERFLEETLEQALQSLDVGVQEATRLYFSGEIPNLKETSEKMNVSRREAGRLLRIAINNLRSPRHGLALFLTRDAWGNPE